MHGEGGACVAEGGLHAGEMATKAGGMHPTEMHSCISINILFLSSLRDSTHSG